MCICQFYKINFVLKMTINDPSSFYLDTKEKWAIYKNRVCDPYEIDGFRVAESL